MSTRLEEITLENVGPVQSLSIPVRPGVIVLRGQNDCGKSETLKAVSRLAGSNDSVSCRDDAAAGYVEGLGIKISVRQSARRTGELEALSIEGKLSIADLVSPPIKDPVAADRHRIKALLQLTGVQADWSMFGHLYGVRDHISHDAMSCTDIVEMAAKIKKDLESASRKEADEAEKAEAQATACRLATDGIDLDIETEANLLQAVLEDASFARGQIIATAQAVKDTKERGEQAKRNLETMALRDRLTEAEILQREAEAVETVRVARVSIATAEREIEEAKARLATASKDLEVAEVGLEAAQNATAAFRREEELLAGWREATAHANAVELPSPDAIEAAERAVTTAREAIEKAAVVRQAKAKAAEARGFFDGAKLHRNAADRLRQSAHETDDVLSKAVASDSLKVRAGRLITKHPERGEVFYAERSDGTRWKLAIDEAIKRIRLLGAEETAIIPIPQTAWSELDPTNKAAIHVYAVKQGVTVVTAEATDGELRAEAFNENNAAIAA